MNATRTQKTAPSLTLPKLALSREGRDTLWLLAVLALSIYPHTGHLPWWCLAGVSGALAWRAYLAVRDGALPPRWTLLVALGISVVLTFMTFRSIFGRGRRHVGFRSGWFENPGVAGPPRCVCDHRPGLFLILTQFLFSQSILTAVMMGVFWGC